ncbi:MAG: nickel pincer cofactor biosynthesis protein LarC, partial [Candidatus Methanofastidiosa archaeon]|nr:nickel pincer cofactor biosynthesis protein LarC [Candidatus Methanofastidiosa archaeon]
ISGTRFEVTLREGGQHRRLEDVIALIQSGRFNEYVENTSINMFTRLAQAESKVHGIPIEDVHFHELGATDSVIDIVGAAICMDIMKFGKVFSSSVELGSGFAECAHGTFPVPAPATMELLKGVPVKMGGIQSEATTPTGATILREFVDEFAERFGLTISKVGYGIGKRDNRIPNVLRAIVAEIDGEIPDMAILLECNLDDMNPELYENLMEELFSNGASDVFLTPVTMKKTRPATKLSVLVKPGLEQSALEIIFKETTTLGIRRQAIEKYSLYRDESIVRTKYGIVRMKHGYLHGAKIKSKPEYEDCKLLARANSVPISAIYDEINRVVGDKD